MQTPKQDGFFMPGEFEVHKGCILIWPSRPGSWRNEAREAKKAFAAVIEAIARSEAVFLAARKEDVAEATNFANELKRKQIPYPVTVFEAKTFFKILYISPTKLETPKKAQSTLIVL